MGWTHNKGDDGAGFVQCLEINNVSDRAVQQLIDPQRQCDDHEKEAQLNGDRHDKDNLVDTVDRQGCPDAFESLPSK